MVDTWILLRSSLLLAAMVVLLAAVSVAGEDLLLTDGFEGTNGSPPDNATWKTSHGPNDAVKIKGNTVETYVYSDGYAAFSLADPFRTDEFDIYVDYMPKVLGGESVNIVVYTNSQAHLTIVYNAHDRRFTFRYIQDGVWKGSTSGITTLFNAEKWYRFNISVRKTTFFSAIFDLDDNRPIIVLSYARCDAFGLSNGLRLGVQDTPPPGNAPTGLWDNFVLIDRTPPPNRAPVWSDVPVLNATEDVPYILDCAKILTDVDDPMDQVTVTTSSMYLRDQDGLNLTFVFPEGVTFPSVSLEAFDGLASRGTKINFKVEPVNDPPTLDVEEEQTAVEDVWWRLNLAHILLDPDNPLNELRVIVDDPYMAVDTYVLVANFPNGVLRHNVTLTVTDGENFLNITLRFTVTPVDDPPSIDGPVLADVLEDQAIVLDLGPFIHDVDTPPQDLRLTVTEENWTVEGLKVLFSYSSGGIEEYIQFMVADATTKVRGFIRLSVEEVNDPPVVASMERVLVTEEALHQLDLSPYLSDEDNPVEDLSVASDDPAVIGVDGLVLSLLYECWRPVHLLNFSVGDGTDVTSAGVWVEVENVNDPPRILGIGDLEPPVQVPVPEGGEVSHQVHVEDEDGERDEVHCEIISDCGWVGIVDGTTLVLVPDIYDAGVYEATVVAVDHEGATDSWDILVVVQDVNFPPMPPEILSPANLSVVERGTNVTFAVSVSDPDLHQGQVLYVEWTSNVSGVLITIPSTEDLMFFAEDLPVGWHNITVRVSDGEFESSAWMEFEVVRRPSTPTEGGGGLGSYGGLIAVVVVLVLVAVVVVHYVNARRAEGPIADAPALADMPALADKPPEAAPMAVGAPPSRESPEGLSAPGAMAREPAPVPSPAIDDGGEEWEETITTEEETPPPPPTEEELAERAHSAQVREVMRALTQLPRGLPTTLWNKDLAELSRQIVDGPRRVAPDGTPLVQVDGTWYVADHEQIGSFLQVWSEEVRDEDQAVSEEAERARKLDQLEARLLEGRISEETYNRLRKKFEG